MFDPFFVPLVKLFKSVLFTWKSFSKRRNTNEFKSPFLFLSLVFPLKGWIIPFSSPLVGPNPGFDGCCVNQVEGVEARRAHERRNRQQRNAPVPRIVQQRTEVWIRMDGQRSEKTLRDEESHLDQNLSCLSASEVSQQNGIQREVLKTFLINCQGFKQTFGNFITNRNQRQIFGSFFFYFLLEKSCIWFPKLSQV